MLAFLAAAVYVVSIRRENLALVALWLPWTYHYLFDMGFFSFCASVASALFAIGFWMRHRDRLGVVGLGVLGGGSC